MSIMVKNRCPTNGKHPQGKIVPLNENNANWYIRKESRPFAFVDNKSRASRIVES